MGVNIESLKMVGEEKIVKSRVGVTVAVDVVVCVRVTVFVAVRVTVGVSVVVSVGAWVAVSVRVIVASLYPSVSGVDSRTVGKLHAKMAKNSEKSTK